MIVETSIGDTVKCSPVSAGCVVGDAGVEAAVVRVGAGAVVELPPQAAASRAAGIQARRRGLDTFDPIGGAGHYFIPGR